MTDINQTLLQKASGETRLKPDEQKHYLGTYRERVLLTIRLEEARLPEIAEQFSTILETLKSDVQPLFIKLSGELESPLQMNYLKQAQALAITASLIEETSNSPFGIVVHTDRAIDRKNISLQENFPQLLMPTTPKPTKPKPFWQKLFG